MQQEPKINLYQMHQNVILKTFIKKVLSETINCSLSQHFRPI